MYEKSDLKNGMILECENDMLFLVILDHCIDDKSYLVGLDREDLKFNDGYIPLSDYDDNLKIIENIFDNSCYDDFDIKNIYIPNDINEIINLGEYKKVAMNETCCKIRDMTLIEIEKELGYKIRIVG